MGVPFSGVILTRPSTLPLVNERNSDVSASGSVERSPWDRVNEASKQLNMRTMRVGGRGCVGARVGGARGSACVRRDVWDACVDVMCGTACVFGVFGGLRCVGFVCCFCVASVCRVCLGRFRLGVLCARRGPVF